MSVENMYKNKMNLSSSYAQVQKGDCNAVQPINETSLETSIESLEKSLDDLDLDDNQRKRLEVFISQKQKTGDLNTEDLDDFTDLGSGNGGNGGVVPVVTHKPNALHMARKSNTYDNTNSIYEPITPRPSSQLSNRSTYSTASGLSSLYSAGYYPPNSHSRSAVAANPLRRTTIGKEAEVDHLTDLLVLSMENSSDPDFFGKETPIIGMCHQCNEKVLGEGSGCTAMDKVYHIQCFTCHICHTELRGKPFYAMDGKPYCEEDYLNTLEKCCVCEKPILDRILRATGKPYHPNCFSCVVCKKCLDGIPFTVDATNQIHCIDDFHKKFAPRCCVCKEPIVPEPGKTETVRVVALDRSFHVSCYKCEDCELLLSSEAEGRGCYPLDDHILCRNCNTKRVQELTAA